MRYTVHSEFAKGLFSYLAKYQKQPAIHNPSRFAIWIIVPLSNLGLLYAPILIFSLPFQILHWCKDRAAIHWILVFSFPIFRFGFYFIRDIWLGGVFSVAAPDPSSGGVGWIYRYGFFLLVHCFHFSARLVLRPGG